MPCVRFVLEKGMKNEGFTGELIISHTTVMGLCLGLDLDDQQEIGSSLGPKGQRMYDKLLHVTYSDQADIAAMLTPTSKLPLPTSWGQEMND